MVSRTPAKPRAEGKFTDAYTPSTSMSAIRALMSQLPRRARSKRTGSTNRSSTPFPTTAFTAIWSSTTPSSNQACEPSSRRSPRLAIGELLRETTLEEMRRFDQVVVR